MPRKAKSANPAKAQRTDLVGNPSPPPSAAVPTGLPYGQHQALEAQAAVSPATDPLRGALDTLASDIALGGPVGMGGPSEFDDEPVTAGLPIGPGRGPEALQFRRRPWGARDALQAVADQTGDSRLAWLAEQLS